MSSPEGHFGLTQSSSCGSFFAALLWMDEIQFAPPKKPWDHDSPANAISHGFVVVQDFVHPQYGSSRLTQRAFQGHGGLPYIHGGGTRKTMSLAVLYRGLILKTSPLTMTCRFVLRSKSVWHPQYMGGRMRTSCAWTNAGRLVCFFLFETGGLW